MSHLRAAGHRLEYKWLHPRASKRMRAAPVLVFLHEGLGSTALWKDFPALVVEATGCSALVYSRYGYGKSDRLTEPRALDYLRQEALDALPQVLEVFSIRRPILIGHSDGASIALIYAGSHVHAVRALVLIAPHVFVEECTVASIRETRVAFEATEMKTKLARYHTDPAGAFWGWNDIWLSPEFRKWNIEDCLTDVHCPLMLVQCQDDPFGTLAQVDAIERQVSGPIDKCILPEGGHSPHLRQKQKTVRMVAEFITRIGELASATGPLDPPSV